MKIKIGLTGATGNLGKTILKNKKKQLIKIYKHDIRDRRKVFRWVEKNKFDVLIHLAAIVPIKSVNSNRKKAKNVNFYGTKNIVDASIKTSVKWFFFSSTSHVYCSSRKKISEKNKTKPISFYGETKLLAEKYIIKKFRNSSTKYCIGRIFSTTNKEQKMNYLVPDLKNRIRKSKDYIILKNLNHYREFISMYDISKIVFNLMKINFNGIINIATGNKILLKNIAKIILKKYKKNKYIFQDNPKATYLVGDITKLSKITGYKPKAKIEKLIF